MSLKNYIGILASLAVIAAGFVPMLHLPVVGNWNYWDLDVRLAGIVLLVAAMGTVSALFKRPAVLRFCGWAILLLLLLTYVGVFFKVHSSFSFIPLQKLASAASGLVKYRWQGWVLQALAAVAMILSGKKERGPVAIDIA